MNISFKRRNFVLGHHPTWRIQIGGSCVNEALQVAFGHLPYSLLRKCMQVSKSWRRLALEELQTRCIIHVSNVNHIKIVLQKLQGCANFRVGKCSIVNVGLDNVLLNKLFFKVQNSLHLLKLVHLAELDELLLFKILDQLPNITHLSVTSPTSKTGTRNESHDHSEECFKFPLLSGRANAVCVQEKHDHRGSNIGEEANYENDSLQVVKYRSMVHLHLDLGPHVAFQLSKIFQVFPNLIELAIANVREESRRKSLKGGEGIAQQPVKLKRLTLRQYSTIGFHEKLVQTLMRLNMHLEKLVVIFHPPTKTLHSCSSLFRQFIESQGCSLKILKLEQVEDHLSPCTPTDTGNAGEQSLLPCVGVGAGKHNYYWDFNYASPSISLLPMCLPNLQVLHVQKPLITNLAQVLHHFPSLKELSLQVCFGCNWKGILPARLEPHEKITRLKIDFIDSDSFTLLGYCFPALQTLQLSYCNESLFYVLCNSIPYFNGGGNLSSCQLCHGTTQEFSAVKARSDDGTLHPVKREDTGVTGPTNATSSTFKKGRCYPVASVMPNNAQHGKFSPREQRQRNLFKNLSLLCVKTCDHLPYEKFAFLQRENHSRTQSFSSDLQEICDGEVYVDDCDENSHISFSWHESTTMNEHFADFPLVDSSESESCSSA